MAVFKTTTDTDDRSRFVTETRTEVPAPDEFATLLDKFFSLAGFHPDEGAQEGIPVPEADIHFDDDVFVFYGDHGDSFLDWSQVGNKVIMYGNGGSDALFGGTNDDEIYGGSGTDLLDGGDGNDTIFGGSGDDFIAGDDGDDELHDGFGEDFIYLGDGDDVVFLTDDGELDEVNVYGGGSDPVEVGFNVIDGFVSGTDKVDLNGAGFEDFNDFMDVVTHEPDGQVWVDLPGSAVLVFTNMSGGFVWDDIVGLG